MRARKVRGSAPRERHSLRVLSLLCASALLAIGGFSVPAPRACPVPSPRIASLPAPPSSSQYREEWNGTPGNPGWYLSDVLVTLIYAGSGSNAYFVYALDGSASQRYANPILVSGDGFHTLNFTLWENGRPGPRVSASWGIDTVHPESTMDLGAAYETNGWFNLTPTVRLLGTDTLSGLDRLQYRIDNGSWQNYSAPVSLSEGIHPFDYRAVDLAGNLEPFHRRAFRIDTERPTIYNLSSYLFRQHEGQAAWYGVDTLSGIDGYAVRVDDGPFIPVGKQETFAFSLPDGVHEIDVQGFDSAGNVAILSIPIRVDTNAFSLTGPFYGELTFLVMLVAAIGVYLSWLRAKRRMRRG